MPAPKGDPTYIKNKEKYFMGVAKAVGACVIAPDLPWRLRVVVRDREILGDGRAS